MTETTHIKVKKNQRDFIQTAAKKFKKPMGEIAYQCVVFVRKNGFDPYNVNEILVAEEFKKLKNQLIGFIRKQEADYIKPLVQHMMDSKAATLNHTAVLQELVAQNATLSGEEDLESEEKPAEALKTSESKKDNASERIILQKDLQLGTLRDKLSQIKAVSTARGKNEVLLKISQEEFEKLVTI